MTHVFRIFILSIFFTLCFQKIVFVDKDTTGKLTGTSWEDAFLNLNRAISDVTSGDKIFLKQGIYSPNENEGVTADSSFVFPKGVEVYGGFYGTESSESERDLENLPETVLSGKGIANHIVKTNLQNYPSVLSGLIFEEGNAKGDDTAGYGGALVCLNSNENNKIIFTVSNCIFRNNKGYTGAAVYLWLGCNPEFIDSTFENNDAEVGPFFGGNGGAFAARNGCDPKLSNCNFISNTAELAGGAIYIDYGSDVSCTNCEFTSNTAGKTGGAIYAFDRNSQLQGTFPVFKSCSFTSNSANLLGGAVCMVLSVTATFEDCTFTSNSANSGNALSYEIEQAQYTEKNCNFGSNQDITTFNKAAYNDLPEFADASVPLEMLNNQKDEISIFHEVFTSKILRVDYKVSNSGDGSSWSNAFRTIQEAIDAAQENTEIWVSQGIYYPTTGRYDETSSEIEGYSIKMKKRVHLFGGFKGIETQRNERDWKAYPTMLDGQYTYNHVVLGGEESLIDGFVIQNGKSGNSLLPPPPTRRGATSPEELMSTLPSSSGAGMANYNVSNYVQNVVFINNVASKAGAVYNAAGTHSFTNVAFINNLGTSRGGCVANDLNTFYCSYCIFYGCLAGGKGGAIYSDFGVTNMVSNSIFVSNIATESGGAVNNDGATRGNITSSIFCSNFGEFDAGSIYQGSYNGTISAISGGGKVYIEDCFFNGDYSTYGNDGFFNWHRDYMYFLNPSTIDACTSYKSQLNEINFEINTNASSNTKKMNFFVFCLMITIVSFFNF